MQTNTDQLPYAWHDVMKRTVRVSLAALVLTICALLGLALRFSPAHVAGRNEAKKPSTSASPTIASTGDILGVGIGSSLEDAHQKLDPLRDPHSAELREKEADEGEAGTKAYWRLVGTEYSWIMIWFNEEGLVVQVSAAVRPEKLKPFEEIGDLSKAAVNLENAAKWNVQRPGHSSYRLVARGPKQHATNIYMMASTLEHD